MRALKPILRRRLIFEIRRDYPEDGVWWLNLMLLEPGYRGNGFGGELLRALERWASSQGAHTFQFIVQKQNVKGFGFWRRMGFIETGRDTQIMGIRENIIIEMKRSFDR